MSITGATAVIRFGLGAAPGEIDLASNNPNAYLLNQLDQVSIWRGNSLPSTAQALSEFITFREARRAARIDKPSDQTVKSKSAKQANRVQNPSHITYANEIAARLKLFASSKTPFLERLVHFWANHFTVSARQPKLLGIVGAFEREAIRPHIGGNFADLLVVVSQHPAMLAYLDNQLSIGPNSPTGKRRQRGLNENHAREILELHTMGVDAGYTTQDIRELAKAMTGWTVSRENAKDVRPHTFYFNKNWHEPGDRTLLGETYLSRQSTRSGEEMLRDLAARPETARFLATKLARHFVSDVPSEKLVAGLADAYQQSGGALPAMYEVLVEHPDSASAEALKFKSPIDFVASSVRGFGLGKNENFWMRCLKILGQEMWKPPSPEGWPDEKNAWLSSDGIKTRFDIANEAAHRTVIDFDLNKRAEELLGNRLTDETTTAARRAASPQQALSMILMSPEFQRR